MFDELLAANREYCTGTTFEPVSGGARKGFALVTCMDSRIDPLTSFGLQRGDAKIMRNAGGRVTPDVLRSLLFATTFLGVTHIAVMHHVDCALAKLDEAAVHAELSPAQTGAIAGLDLRLIDDPDAALASDVAAVRDCVALGEVRVEGWRYDVFSGGVARVVTSAG